MAEINVPQNGGRRKLQPPRIDFTPMVDLGFLLISFFMFTTTLAQQKSIVLNMPSNELTDVPAAVAEESVISLIAIDHHNIVYYEGAFNDPEQLKKCSITQIRDILLKKKSSVAALPAKYSAAAHKIYVLIKPANNSTYADMVQLLDEMNILGIQNYTIVDITAQEQESVQKKFP